VKRNLEANLLVKQHMLVRLFFSSRELSQEGKENDLRPSYIYNACGSYKVNKSDQYFGEDEFFE